MKKTTYLMIACSALLLAGGLYYFLKDEPLVPKAPVEVEKVEQVSTLSYVGNSIKEEKDGKPLWELGAETIEIDVTTKNISMKNIKGTFFQANGGKINITAPGATLDNKTKDIVMTGKVQAIASDGATFTAEETRWSGQQEIFYGSGNVVLTKDDSVMTGDKIESDANMAKIKVYGNARIVTGGASK